MPDNNIHMGHKTPKDTGNKMTSPKPVHQQIENFVFHAEKILAVIRQNTADGIAADHHLVNLLNLQDTINMLRHNDQNFRVLADANLIGVGFADPTGNMTYINDEMLRMMGHTRADFETGRINWENCLAPELLPATGSLTRHLMKKAVISTHEWAFIRPDGGRTPFLGAAAQIEADADSHVITALDLTRVREAENRKWKSDQRLRMAADSLDIGVFEWNLSKNTAFWENDQMYAIFGRTREQGPLNFSDFVEQSLHYDDRCDFLQEFSKARQPGNIFGYTCRVQSQGRHNPFWIEITGKFYNNHFDSSLCMIGLAKDISQQKQYEHTIIQTNEVLEQRARERTDKIRNQADRLRVLANRLGQVEQKERKRLASVLHDHIQPLVVGARMQIWEILRKNEIDAAHKTARKIEDILAETLAELRSLTVDLSPSAILNDGLIGGLNWLGTYMAKKFNFKVEFFAKDEIDPISENTCYLLFQCIKELLLNAVKYSGEDHARISVERTKDHKIRIMVADNGQGFDLEEVTGTQENMTSLGLFSIEERLKDIGGRMVIDSAPGQGATITLTVPAGEKYENNYPFMDRRKSDKKNMSPISARTPKDRIGILIVDDHKLLREGLTGLLQMETDFEVVGEAADAPTAVELAETLLPDVVLMDVNLGETNGMDATRQILSKDPDIKVIALSMHSDKKVIKEMYEAGASIFLNKTIPSDDLVTQIRESLSEN
jgi:PAS domain S-box-containing protein